MKTDLQIEAERQVSGLAEVTIGKVREEKMKIEKIPEGYILTSSYGKISIHQSLTALLEAIKNYYQ